MFGKVSAFISGAANLHSLERLRDLDVSGCDGLNELSFESIQGCNRLERLKMRRLPQLEDHQLAEIVGHCPHLTHVDVTGSRQVGAASIQALSELRHLCGLALGSCHLIVDEDLMRAMQTLPGAVNPNPTAPSRTGNPNPNAGLCDLEIGSCTQLSDATVEAVTRCCPHLNSLDLSRNRHVTSRALEPLVEAQGLLVLNVARCPGISLLDVERWNFRCPETRVVWEIGEHDDDGYARVPHQTQWVVFENHAAEHGGGEGSYPMGMW